MHSLFSPVSEASRGISFFIRGLSWLKSHPRYFILLLFPAALSTVLLIFFWGVFYQNSDHLLSYILFDKPEGFWLQLLYYIAMALLYVAIIVLGLVFFMLGINVISSPIFDYVSSAVERDVLKSSELGEISLLASILLMKEELKKVAFIFLISMLVLIIPGVNLVSPLIAAFFVGWDVCDYPLARKGWSFRKRLGFVTANFWSVTGLGVWLIIPGVQMFLMPLAVTGGTMLSVENINRVKK